VAAAAIAAGVFFAARHTQREGGAASVDVATSPAQPVSSARTVAQAQPAIPVASMAADDRGVDPASLPPAPTAVVAARETAIGPAPAAAKPALPPAARTTTPAHAADVPTATAPPSAGVNLQTLMQQAAGVTSAPAAPATTSPDAPLGVVGSVPLRPSQGAIQGALGAVLPSARACLGPDDAISHAAITFGSDGSVVNVGVSGGAAGKPAEGCIRVALMKARVAPFAQPTFTGTVTVRPN